MLEIYQKLQVVFHWQTKELIILQPIPEHINPAPHMEVIDTKLFISTALERLECQSPLLRDLAYRSLKAVIKHLNL